jgi:hypothetical protein
MSGSRIGILLAEQCKGAPMGVSFAARLSGGIVLIAASIGAMLALAGIHTPARSPLVLTFLAVAPACAAAWSLRRLDPLARLAACAPPLAHHGASASESHVGGQHEFLVPA